MKTYAELFREYIRNEYGLISEDEVDAVWFTEHEGCYPDGYLDEEVSQSIITKFYAPLRFLTSLLEGYEQWKFRVTVMPSYEGSTCYNVTFEDVILYEDYCKAWHFWFDGDIEFNAWAKGVHERMADILRIRKPVPTPTTT